MYLLFSLHWAFLSFEFVECFYFNKTYCSIVVFQVWTWLFSTQFRESLSGEKPLD